MLVALAYYLTHSERISICIPSTLLRFKVPPNSEASGFMETPWQLLGSSIHIDTIDDLSKSLHAHFSGWWVHSYFRILEKVSDFPKGKNLCPKELFFKNSCEVKCLQGNVRVSPFDLDEEIDFHLYSLTTSRSLTAAGLAITIGRSGCFSWTNIYLWCLLLHIPVGAVKDSAWSSWF